MQSMNANNKKNYPKAKKFASLAVLMVVINILFTLCVGLIVIITVLWHVCADPGFNFYALSELIKTEIIKLIISPPQVYRYLH